ncbi:unnamed protein product [Closterium sp. Yama58-4]|nr:unnamed protein product [Closterium sp. Yama58-4]
MECIPNEAAQGGSVVGVLAKREKPQSKKRQNQDQQQEPQQDEERLPKHHVQLFDQGEQEGGGTEQESGAPTRPFVYVYDLGEHLTTKVLKLEQEWYSEQYDLEKHLTEMLMKRTDNPVRTMDPEKASLFFVPFYVSRYLFSFFHNDQKNMRQCIEKSSRAWTKVLKAVRTTFPYFNRTNGRDHFGVLTLDHGRCHSLTFVDPRLVGEMFFVTYNGDKLVRSDHAANDPSMQLLSYQYGAPADPTIPSIPCYMPDRDITVPVIVRAQVPFVSPFATPRKWTAIFRFVASPHKDVKLDVRSRILQAAKADMAPGWDLFPKSEERTDQDWQHSVFCICPPGHSQWTSRPFKALISGCIPVTFFREHDNPWQDTLNYDAFSVNIDPDDVPRMRERLEKANVPMLQKGVEQVQDTLIYDAFSVNIDPDAVPSMRARLEKANVPMLQKGVEQVQHLLKYDAFSVNIHPDDVPSMRARLEQANVAMLQKGVEHVQVGVEHVQVGVEHVQVGVEHVQVGVEHVQVGVEHVQVGVEHAQVGVCRAHAGGCPCVRFVLRPLKANNISRDLLSM